MQEGVVFSTMDDLEDYFEYSHSSSIYLTLELFGIRDEAASYIASHVGVGGGIASILRGVSHQATEVVLYATGYIVAIWWGLFFCKSHSNMFIVI